MISDAKANPNSTRTDSGVRLTRTTHGTHQVELWGVMPVGWLGNFTRGATRMSLDIVRGVAQRGSQRQWSASFEMRGAVDVDFEQVDFLSLAREASSSPPAIPLVLQRYQLTRSSERMGALELRIGAPDRVGFLASLLEHLAGFVLFPEEISIDTFEDEARDMLLLSSVGGQPPPPEIEEALRVSLRAFTRDRASLFPGA